ncbi:TetR/AcrR family transcriptional regulator [Streptomyces sp. NPDC004838]
MALPRFHRLPDDTKAAILAIARTHFARDGKDAASFNRIIAEAGISKTSAYHYFDGKDDLFAEVAADTAARTLAALGPWTEAATPDELWGQMRAGTVRLLEHLRTHPEDRAVLATRPPGAEDGDAWIAQAVANARGIGLIGPDPGPELITLATGALLGTLDGWALHHPDTPDATVADTLVLLLARLWK